eukprot:447520-Prorocentrum_minimum.AAC.1
MAAVRRSLAVAGRHHDGACAGPNHRLARAPGIFSLDACGWLTPWVYSLSTHAVGSRSIYILCAGPNRAEFCLLSSGVSFAY